MFRPVKTTENTSPSRTETVVLQPLPGIGDMIWHLPVLRAIAATDPSGKIDLIAHEKLPVRPLLANEDFIGHHLPLPMGRGLKRRLKALFFVARSARKQGYTCAIILHHSWRYALALRLAGIKHVYGYGYGPQKHFVTQKDYLPLNDQKIFPLYRAKKLLGLLGIAPHHEPPHLQVLPITVQSIEQAYADLPQPWVALAVGATQAVKCWPPEYFAAVADALWEAGYRSLFVLGAPHETALVQSVIRRCRTAQPMAVSDLPLDQVIALISRCAFAVCTDSGLMNVTVSVGVPAYGLFGATPPLDYSPLLRVITPPDGLDLIVGAAKIPVAQVLARLSADGLLNGGEDQV